jgi:hypothetical protein
MSAQHQSDEIIAVPNFPVMPECKDEWLRRFDYAAYRKDYASGHLIGYGATPELAVADLRAKEDDQ